MNARENQKRAPLFRQTVRNEKIHTHARERRNKSPMMRQCRRLPRPGALMISLFSLLFSEQHALERRTDKSAREREARSYTCPAHRARNNARVLLNDSRLGMNHLFIRFVMLAGPPLGSGRGAEEKHSSSSRAAADESATKRPSGQYFKVHSPSVSRPPLENSNKSR